MQGNVGRLGRLSSTCGGSCGGARAVDAILSVKIDAQYVEKQSTYHIRQGFRRKISTSSTGT